LDSRNGPRPRRADGAARARCHLEVERVEDRRLLTTITVTGVGDTIADDGVVTLREAITAANTNAPSGDAPAGTAGLDTIAFDIPGQGVHTNDGLVQANKIGVNAAGTATTYTNGVDIRIDSCTPLTIGGTIAGAANIIGVANVGISIDESSGVLVQGNFIGIDPTGTLNVGKGIWPAPALSTCSRPAKFAGLEERHYSALLSGSAGKR
jgi:hypothetical protein